MCAEFGVHTPARRLGAVRRALPLRNAFAPFGILLEQLQRGADDPDLRREAEPRLERVNTRVIGGLNHQRFAHGMGFNIL